MFESLRDALDQLATQVRSDDELDSAESDALMARIHAAVPSMRPDEVSALHRQLEGVISLIAAKKGHIDDELSKIQKGRKALNGYDHLVDHHKSQRLYRRV